MLSHVGWARFPAHFWSKIYFSQHSGVEQRCIFETYSKLLEGMTTTSVSPCCCLVSPSFEEDLTRNRSLASLTESFGCVRDMKCQCRCPLPRSHSDAPSWLRSPGVAFKNEASLKILLEGFFTPLLLVLCSQNRCEEPQTGNGHVDVIARRLIAALCPLTAYSNEIEAGPSNAVS